MSWSGKRSSACCSDFSLDSHANLITARRACSAASCSTRPPSSALLEPIADALVVGAGALRVPRVGQGSVLALRGLVLVRGLLVVRPATHPGGVVDAVVSGVGRRQRRRGRDRRAEEDAGYGDSHSAGSKTSTQRIPCEAEQVQREPIAISTASSCDLCTSLPGVRADAPVRTSAGGTAAPSEVPVRAPGTGADRAGAEGRWHLALALLQPTQPTRL